MPFKNNGYKRFKTLTVVVKLNGSVQTTTALPFMSAFTQGGVTYPAVTGDQLSKLPLVDYNTRATAYAAYVQANYQSQYPGLTVSAVGSRVYDDTACPLN